MVPFEFELTSFYFIPVQHTKTYLGCASVRVLSTTDGADSPNAKLKSPQVPNKECLVLFHMGTFKLAL